MWATADETVNFPISYKVDGEFVIPTSATATVRDNTGAAIGSLTDVSLDTTGTSTQLEIPAGSTSIGSGKDFELRFITVKFEAYGASHFERYHLYLSPFVPYAVTPAEVRNELGLDLSELPDRDIQIMPAFLELKRDYGSLVVDALTGSSEEQLAVNRAIRLKAALSLVDSLTFRAALKMKAEDSAMERIAGFNVEDIRNRLAKQMATALRVLDGVASEGSPILVLSSPTDVITGE